MSLYFRIFHKAFLKIGETSLSDYIDIFNHVIYTKNSKTLIGSLFTINYVFLVIAASVFLYAESINFAALVSVIFRVFLLYGPQSVAHVFQHANRDTKCNGNKCLRLLL